MPLYIEIVVEVMLYSREERKTNVPVLVRYEMLDWSGAYTSFFIYFVRVKFMSDCGVKVSGCGSGDQLKACILQKRQDNRQIIKFIN